VADRREVAWCRTDGLGGAGYTFAKQFGWTVAHEQQMATQQLAIPQSIRPTSFIRPT